MSACVWGFEIHLFVSNSKRENEIAWPRLFPLLQIQIVPNTIKCNFFPPVLSLSFAYTNSHVTSCHCGSVHACSWRFDFHWTQHVCVFFFLLSGKCKNVLRKSTNERRSDGKDHLYIRKKKSLDCEHLILLLIVQTDEITATITSITLWNAKMLSNRTQNENTIGKTVEKTAEQVNGFVYWVVYSLLWNDITLRQNDSMFLGILHFFFSSSFHFTCILIRSLLAFIVWLLFNHRSYFKAQTISFLLARNCFPSPLLPLCFFNIIIFSIVAAVPYFLFAVKAECRNYSYLFVIIIRIWWTHSVIFFYFFFWFGSIWTGWA